MNNRDFNKKYGLSTSLVEGSLKKYIPKTKETSFSNVAGKPKKLVTEIFKRFFSNWIVVLSLALFILILLISIIVNLSSAYSSVAPVSGNINLFLLNGKPYEGGSSSFVKYIPPSYNQWVNSELYVGDSEIYTRNTSVWFNPSNYGGYVGKEIFGTEGVGFRIQQNTIFVNATRWYDANTMWILLENSPGITKNASFEETAAAVAKLRELNPEINYFLPLGTNSLGVDVWTSSWVGTWNAIRLAIVVATIQTFIGVAVGSYLGFHVGKWIDTVVMRIIDIISAPQTIIWLLLFVGLFGTTDLTLGFALVFVGWTSSVGGARLFIITVKDEEYITASKSIGVSKPGLIYRHALPAIIGKIATSYVSSIPGIIFWVSSLAFLGFFRNTETANLGASLSSAASEAGNNLWILLLPSLILLTISVSLHYVALGLHDALDPKVIRTK